MKSDWISWFGGDCPVAPYTSLDVFFRDGTVDDFGNLAWELNWSHFLADSDIIMYRLHKKPEELEKTNPYRKPFPYEEIDIYRVLEVYNVTSPAVQHAVKKLLCAGQRGYKEIDKDVEEAIQALHRYQEMQREESKI